MSSRTLHPFPARMAPSIATDTLAREAGSAARLTVLDPMCGSGTVLTAAIEAGHHAKGLDLDPLAVLMSRVAIGKLDTDALIGAAAQAVTDARRLRRTYGPWNDSETHAFADYWFGSSQRHQLVRLAASINEAGPTEVRHALQVALSRTIVTKEPKASLARDTAHSRPHKVLDSSDYDVYEGFLASCSRVAALLATRTMRGRGHVDSGDARSMRSVQSASIDRIITSPPYLNAIDYLRGHRLALIWFGYTLGELRRIRASAIGAERGLHESDKSEEVRRLWDLVSATCAHPDRLPKSVMLRYQRTSHSLQPSATAS
jgi:hypothetical protein